MLTYAQARGPPTATTCAVIRSKFNNGETVFRHACTMGLEGIVSKRKTSPYRSGRSPDWLKTKNPACAAVEREAEENWAGEGVGQSELAAYPHQQRREGDPCAREQSSSWSVLSIFLASPAFGDDHKEATDAAYCVPASRRLKFLSLEISKVKDPQSGEVTVVPYKPDA
jgi:hypothetical protein